MPAEPLTHLGTLPVGDFMRRYWHKRPIVVRAAIEDFAPPVSIQRLFELAARDDVESRLVTAFGDWRLRHGPLARVPSAKKPRWTLLVQGVDTHDDAAAALLARFRFVPDARLDDLMISYASDGGGVGPHVDSYDVFLLQARGRRRWRISRQRDHAFVPGLPLKILADFRPSTEWVLEPGDLLYLPPGVAHEGVAVSTDCMTCSIGFRAPAWQELVDPLLDALGQRLSKAGRYRDPQQLATRTPGRLPAALLDAAFKTFEDVRPRRGDIARMLLATLTEPKPAVVFDAPSRRLSAAAFQKAAHRHGVALDRRTRLLYNGAHAAINGEAVERADTAGLALQALADQRKLPAASLADPDAAFWTTLYAWYEAGWLHVAEAAPMNKSSRSNR